MPSIRNVGPIEVSFTDGLSSLELRQLENEPCAAAWPVLNKTAVTPNPSSTLAIMRTSHTMIA
jgi:hypothetical protein